MPTIYKVLRPGALAKAAIAEHPDWTDSRLAEEYGISAMTIGRARKSIATNVAAYARRIGKDGKSYPAKDARAANKC